MKSQVVEWLKRLGRFFGRLLTLAGTYFLVEVWAFCILKPEEYWCFAFCACWALLFAGICLILPRLAGRIFFGVTYYFALIWTMAQTAYYSVFSRIMWLSDVVYAGEGAGYLLDVLSAFPLIWWIGGFVLTGLGALLIWKFPKTYKIALWRLPYALIAVLSVVGLITVPELVFLRDRNVWGTYSEYAQSSSYRATYNTMYDAENVYDICGIYQLTFRDIWVHELYPLTPAYRNQQAAQTEQIKQYFDERGASGDNEMTGIFEGKNVVLVLMESMDDWMITREDTPVLYNLMNQGINFTEFYTPGYGTARTINSEFCMNTGIYLPTTGRYVFDYVTNSFNQSIAAQATDNGYTAEVFHYNTPDFYSRGVFEPAMGYDGYNCYADYETDKNRLYDDCLLFDIPALSELFFREGKTFNTIITRSAHLGYKYNEVLGYYGLKKYPEYRGKYGSEEENCARVKAKLVDDMFKRLLDELTARGMLKNTVIIGMTDHYTYGYNNVEELCTLSGVEDEILLEKTPCFVWSADGPCMQVDKTLSTADFLPTMLNLLGYDSPYSYLGQDAFEPDYEGYALFPDGSWISDGVVCKVVSGGKTAIVQNKKGKLLTQEYLEEMAKRSQQFIHMSNLLLTSDYYKNIQ